MSFTSTIYNFLLLSVEFMPTTLVLYLPVYLLFPRLKVGFLWASLGFLVTATLSAATSLLAIPFLGAVSYTPDINNMAPFYVTRFGVPLILSVVICMAMKSIFKDGDEVLH
ncbi:MAG: hypothetical protein B7Z35_13515 [Hydrogenophilales bacterium 12-61-10]|nr:MAG: hypothetical protein B7Z35_13515 [Hydrogenophilales bacterium 12-61-10]